MLSIKFVSGELVQNVPWLSLPNKPIQRIKYIFNNKTIILENFESYNHLQEKVYNILGGNMFIRAVYLMGRYNNSVKVIRLNLINGTIKEEEYLFGEEYNGKPSTGWKSGIVGQTPQYKIL